jgi:hypothetical protein
MTHTNKNLFDIVVLNCPQGERKDNKKKAMIRIDMKLPKSYQVLVLQNLSNYSHTLFKDTQTICPLHTVAM